MRNFYKFTFIILFSYCTKAQVPTTTITSASTVFCTGTTQTFAAITTETAPTFSWTIAPARNITLGSDINSPVVTFTPASPGTFTVTLRAANTETTYVITKIFNVTRSAKASFNASLSGQGFPASLYLTNYSTGSFKNYWLFDGNTAEKDSSATLTKGFSTAGSHTVTLLSLGLNGCNDRSDYVFRIADSSGVTLPNVFSPNNDEINDIYKPIARGITKLNAWVYNRHGVVITSWNKVSGFWDGYTTSGEPCVAGEYFIVLEATGFDGQHYKLKSSITLIR